MSTRRVTIVDKDPILRQKARAVQPEEFGSAELNRLAEDMIETMYATDGVGLAAPQVNVGLRLFAMDTGDGPAVLVNPKVTARSKKTAVETEGCLSCTGQEVKVERFRDIAVAAQTLDGQKINFTAKDFLARVIQHETDHLNGILIVDK